MISLWHEDFNQHYARILLRRTDQSASSWWLQMTWCQIGARPSTTTLLSGWCCTIYIPLTHYGLLPPFGDIDLGQHWLGWWLVAWWHQAMHCWANGDLSWAAEVASASAIFPVFNFGVGDIGLTLRWRHNGRDSVSNHQPHDCLLKRRSQKTSKLRVTGLCSGNSSGTGEFPAQMASNAENVSIWWRHHENRVAD